MRLFQQRKRKKKIEKYAILLLFLGPPLIFFTIFVILPIIQAGYYSFFKWNGLGPVSHFYALNNFYNIITDKVFIKSFLNNCCIILFSMLIQLPMAFMLAVIVSRKTFPGVVFFRLLFFLPFILSEVITGVLWQFLYHPQYGIFQYLLGPFLGEGVSIGLLGNVKTVFPAIFAVLTWKYFGLHMVIYIAGIQNIPGELEEAAVIDGCTRWQIIRNIIIPLSKPSILISVFFSIIGSLTCFDIIWAMGKGDPAHAAEVMVTYLYKYGFLRFQMGYGSAVAVVIFLICLGFNIFYQQLLIKRERD
ncbi:MAG: sugar ABC transporter permease [Spirochaetales bacterium]|nr:sugar ABC transporter permease [Spirochaetales bacterium]